MIQTELKGKKLIRVLQGLKLNLFNGCDDDCSTGLGFTKLLWQICMIFRNFGP